AMISRGRPSLASSTPTVEQMRASSPASAATPVAGRGTDRSSASWLGCALALAIAALPEREVDVSRPVDRRGCSPGIAVAVAGKVLAYFLAPHLAAPAGAAMRGMALAPQRLASLFERRVRGQVAGQLGDHRTGTVAPVTHDWASALRRRSSQFFTLSGHDSH